MKRPMLIACEYHGDSFCALWLDEGGTYVLGWLVGLSAEPNKEPISSSRMRFRDREQAADRYGQKLAELREMAL